MIKKTILEQKRIFRNKAFDHILKEMSYLMIKEEEYTKADEYERGGYGALMGLKSVIKEIRMNEMLK